MNRSPKKLIAIGGTAVVAVLAIGPATPAHADPQFVKAYVGVGSDTIQDVMNALSGFTNGTSYAPIQSSAATGYKQILSFDAIDPATKANNGTCIATKLGGNSFGRPNGSGQGRQALSRAIDGGDYGATSACGAAKTGGQVDFARSSSVLGTAAASGAPSLTYVPFGRDGVSVAYYNTSGTPITDISTTDLKALYQSANGTSTVTTGTGASAVTTTLIACLPQSGSGTRSFFVGAVQANDAAAGGHSDTNCGTGATGNGIEENNASSLKTAGSSKPANTQLVIPFSAASFIAQQNGAAPSTFAGATDVGLSSIDTVAPFAGTAPALTPNADFYNSTTYGRNVYNVFPTSKVTGIGDAGLKSLFVGTGSAICGTAAQATVNKFGFLSLGGTCGSTTTTSALQT